MGSGQGQHGIQVAMDRPAETGIMASAVHHVEPTGTNTMIIHL